MLSFENLGRPTLELPELTATEFDSGLVMAKTDLKLTLVENRDATGAVSSLSASLFYAADLFDEATVIGFADRFLHLVRTVVDDADAVVGDIDIWNAPEVVGRSAAAPTVDDLPRLVSGCRVQLGHDRARAPTASRSPTVRWTSG